MKGIEKILASTQRFGRLADEFHKESDRGCAVLVMCVLEEALRDMIKAFVVDPKDIGRLMPHGGLDVGINSAVMLGLLSEHQARAFKSLVAVRNKFAHGVMEQLTFDTPMIANLVRSAEPVIPLPAGYDLDASLDNKSVRTRFLMLASLVWMLLIMLEPNIERRKAATDPDMTKMPPGLIDPTQFP